MRNRHVFFWLASATVLVSLLLQPSSAGAQCVVTSTSVYPGSGYISVLKFLDGEFPCQLTASNNVYGCAPSTSAITGVLVAAAFTPAVNPSCGWVCDCGSGFTSVHFTIDGSDGLPVELLMFGIDEAADPEGGG